MPDPKPINEQELDELLRDLFLEEGDPASEQQKANLVFSQHYPAEMDTAREQQLISRLHNTSSGTGHTGLYTLGVIAVIVSALAIYFSSRPKHQAKAPISATTAQSVALATTSAPQAATSSTTNTHGPNPEAATADTFDRPVAASLPLTLTDSTLQTNVKTTAMRSAVAAGKTLPVLTEKDRLKYLGIKQQMITWLVKFDRSLYTRIPAYKTVHAGEPVVLDGFAIRNVGITNLEYKAFLADLIAKNRKDDYITCEVQSDNWRSHDCPGLANSYFQDKTYNDFPVVNISYEAARLFCQWLEEETALFIRQHNPRLKTLFIRLPYDEEWVYAAREGYAKIAFEKGYNTIYDESAGLVNRSFTNRVELVKKHAERVDTLYSYYATNRFGWEEKDISAFFAEGLSYYENNSADTIIPARMKVLGKFGHVSEMVPQKNSNKLWLSGLSWTDKSEYQKLEQEFKRQGSSPFVGFRIVVINPNDPEYKNPFW